MLDSSNFKFVLYMAFPTEEEAIGIQLCKGLEQIVQDSKNPIFEFHLRLSGSGPRTQSNQQRWDQDFLEGVLTSFQGQISKVWVCGPPRMNEEFDRALSKMASDFKLGRDQIEIL